jgi:hypothetical protein
MGHSRARLNGIKHWGFEPRRASLAFPEATAARNTVRYQCWTEGRSSVCS